MPDDDLDSDQTDLVPRAHIRQLEERAKQAKDLEAQLVAMQRENAFAKALGNADHPARTYFEKGYDGELTPDAIRTAAKDAGLFAARETQGTPDNEPNQPTSAEMAAQARMAAASDGAGGNKPIDLVEAMGPRGSKTQEELMQMLRAAGPGAPFRLSEDMQ